MQKKLILLVVFLSIVMPCGIFAAQKHGWFENKVVGEWLVEKEPDRSIKLSIDFYYHDPSGKRWPAPRGSIVDGASIPKVFWNLYIGPPFVGNYRRASVVHDIACDMKEKICPSSEIAHRMFYDACLCGGVNKKKAELMYWAVRTWGPKWGSQNPEDVLSRQQYIELMEIDAFIKSKGISVNSTAEEIERALSN